MARADLDGWAQIFVTDLGSDGAWVPFDRAVFRHRQQLDSFLARGLTYSSLAGAIDRAGGRRPDGRSYTGKQLNTALRRARRYEENSDKTCVPAPSPMPERQRLQRQTDATEQISQRRPHVSFQPEAGNSSPTTVSPLPNHTISSDLGQDLSDDDISAALAQIRRADP